MGLPEWPNIAQQQQIVDVYPTAEKLAQVVAKRLQEFKAPSFDVIAHSYGCAVLSYVWLYAPEMRPQLRKKVMIDPLTICMFGNWLRYGYMPRLNEWSLLLSPSVSDLFIKGDLHSQLLLK